MYVFPIQNMCVLTLGSVVMMIYAERFSLHSRMIVPQVPRAMHRPSHCPWRASLNLRRRTHRVAPASPHRTAP